MKKITFLTLAFGLSYTGFVNAQTNVQALTQIEYFDTLGATSQIKTFTYNNDGNQTSKELMNFIPNTYGNRDTLIYNSNKLLASKLSLNYNTLTTNWDSSYVENFIYDNNGNTLERNTQYYSSGAWVNSFKEEFTYNQDDKKELKIRNFYNPSTLTWDSLFKIHYIYDTGSGLLTQEHQEQWDNSNSVFYSSFKTNYYYNNSFSVLDSIVSEYYDNGSSSWVPSQKNIYTYDANDRKVQSEDYYWNSGSSAWVGSGRNVYVYNADGNMELERYYQYNTTNQSYNSYASDSTIAVYDNNYTRQDLLIPNEILNVMPNGFVHKLDTTYRYGYNSVISAMEKTADAVFTYTAKTISGSLPTGLDDKETELSVKLYPNPTSDILNIKLNNNNTNFTISIYNEVGQKLMSAKNQTTLNISNLKSGFYSYVIVSDTQSKSGTLVKK